MLLFRKVYPSGDPTRFAPILFQKLDSDGGGSVDFEKLMVFNSAWYRGNAREWVTLFFRVLDVDNDGVVSREDCATTLNSWHMANAGTRMPTGAEPQLSSSVQAIFSALEINNEGFVTLQAVLDLCSKDTRSIERVRDFSRILTADLSNGWGVPK